MKDAYLETPGIAYRTNAFDPNRKTLVFIHGLSGTCAAWAPFEEALGNTFNIVTYDLRGHGLSNKFLRYRDYDLKNFANDLETLRDHLRLDSFSLVAHSMGTTVALEYLHYYPGHVQSVLFLAPNYKQHALAGKFNVRLLETAVQFLSSLSFIPKPGARLDYTDFGYSPDIDLRRIIPEIKNLTVRVYLYCLQHLYRFNHDGWWQEIRVPATVLHGTHDFFIPYSFGVEAAQRMHAKLVTLKGANHMLVLNNQKEIIEEIQRLY